MYNEKLSQPLDATWKFKKVHSDLGTRGLILLCSHGNQEYQGQDTMDVHIHLVQQRKRKSSPCPPQY